MAFHTLKKNQLTAAAKSNCPPTGFAPALRTGGGAAAALGLEAVGIGGFPGTLGAGLAPTTGGLGFAATGGGGLDASELEGLELAGESSVPEGVFFQGVAEPLEGAIPGNTDTGFADGLASTD